MFQIFNHLGTDCRDNDRKHLHGHCCRDLSSGDGILNTALVSPACDFEETVVSPLFIPAVFHQPVILTVHGAPTHDLNCVATEEAAGRVLVDAAFVCWEVG